MTPSLKCFTCMSVSRSFTRFEEPIFIISYADYKVTYDNNKM